MRLDIRYRTRFRYASSVSESQNELRACPATDDRQSVVHYDVTTTPSSRIASYTDHWGTRVDTFGIRAPHGSLDVVAEATVDTAPQALITTAPRLAQVEDVAFHDAHLEFLAPSPHTRSGPAVAEAAARAAELGGDDLLNVVLSVHRAVGSHLSYAAGSTYVGVPVDEVLASGRGVCQDYAHIAIAMYRALGIPARYVSGYLFTADDATGEDATTDEVEVQTHAWVEVAVPVPDGGRRVTTRWFALDPTNQQEVGERHVTIGRGRDYDDVAPFRGVYAGGSEHELDVAVTMRRLAAESSGPPPASASTPAAPPAAATSAQAPAGRSGTAHAAPTRGPQQGAQQQ